MRSFSFKHVRIEALAFNRPPIELNSAELEDRVGSIYKRLGIPFGTLEKLSGVKNRYFWTPEISPSQVSTEAARMALEQAAIAPEQLGDRKVERQADDRTSLNFTWRAMAKLDESVRHRLVDDAETVEDGSIDIEKVKPPHTLPARLKLTRMMPNTTSAMPPSRPGVSGSFNMKPDARTPNTVDRNV